MSPENFVYWVNGFFEISGSKTLTEEQVQVVKDHLELVLTKKTPDVTINSRPFNTAIDTTLIPCSSTNIDLSKDPVRTTITITDVSPLTVDDGVSLLTESSVSFENNEPFICFAKSGLK
jgi:hypothetical protein